MIRVNLKDVPNSATGKSNKSIIMGQVVRRNGKLYDSLDQQLPDLIDDIVEITYTTENNPNEKRKLYIGKTETQHFFGGAK